MPFSQIDMKSSPFFSWSYDITQSMMVLPEFLFMNLVSKFELPCFIRKFTDAVDFVEVQ
jgi:hypothetical protein